MDRETVVLEGFHACKHAVRFGANIIELVTADRSALETMTQQYAPDVAGDILDQVQEIDREQFSSYSDIQIRTPLAGKVHLGTPQTPISNKGIIILLDNPRDLENIGAVVRLAAGMDASAVITTGDVNPWHKNCLRGSQGLHFAIPVYHINNLPADVLVDRPVIAFDEQGSDLVRLEIPNNAVLVFGSERRGVSKDWLERSDHIVKIPQRDGVSSYNLATSVAMGVYHAKLAH